MYNRWRNIRFLILLLLLIFSKKVIKILWLTFINHLLVNDMEQMTGEHFLDIDDDMLNYLEKQGEETVREIYQSGLNNKESGQKLLSILIVGIGSSFLFLRKVRTSS